LLTYQYDSTKKFFTGFLTANPKIKLTPVLKLHGLRALLDEIGVREFREMTKRYGNSAWYSLNKEMKGFGNADEEYYLTSEYLLWLASKASELFKSFEPQEKRILLKATLQNLVLDGRKVRFDWVKPFDKIAFFRLSSSLAP
jgi:hypothetical protein